MTELFGPRAEVERLVAVEAALTRAAGQVGLLSQDVALRVGTAIEQVTVDASELLAAGLRAGTSIIPLIALLREHVGPNLATAVHLGATSQDILDTATMVAVRAAIAVLRGQLGGIVATLARFAQRHAATPMMGRTLLQHALPTTFGLVAAGWMTAVADTDAGLAALTPRLAVQLGGPVGTGASFEGRAAPLAEALARSLGLAVPILPWHTDRSRVMAIAAAVGAVAGQAERIAGDLLLLAQSDVGEIHFTLAAGEGTSSAMAHKQNPVHAIFAVAAAAQAPGLVGSLGNLAARHQLQRAAGAWQAEWTLLPQLFIVTATALERLAAALDTMVVNAQVMEADLAVGCAAAYAAGSLEAHIRAAQLLVERALLALNLDVT